MKNLIMTCTDEKYGNFTIHHWLRSLLDNVNLENTEILILDYGMNKNQIKSINSKYVNIVKCKRDGAVVDIRFRDLYNYIKKKKYDQIMCIDGGDVIIQTDISLIFKKNKNMFRGVTERSSFPFILKHLRKKIVNSVENKIANEIFEEVKFILENKPMVNAGVIIGPYKKFLKLLELYLKSINSMDKFAVDQIIINYVFYKNDFIDIGCKYNFLVWGMEKNFYVNNGIFYFSNGSKIPIIHNAGGFNLGSPFSHFFRPINKFGYGSNYNKEKIALKITRLLISLFNSVLKN